MSNLETSLLVLKIQIIIIIIFNPSVLSSRGKETKQGVNDCNGGLLGRKSAQEWDRVCLLLLLLLLLEDKGPKPVTRHKTVKY